jgi:phage terminase large subunit
MTEREVAVARMHEWQHSGVAFAEDVFPGFKADPWQRQVLERWTSPKPEHQRIAMQACAGPGKSAIKAICGFHALTCMADEGHHPQGYAISVTRENLRDGLWKEMQVWRQRSPLMMKLFEWQKERIFSRQYPDTWWLAARSFSKAADPEAAGNALSGLHARFIFYLIDEAGDMPSSIPRKAEQGLATADIVFGKILMGGNPTTQDGALYECVHGGTYDVIRITGDPDDPMRSSRINIEWARKQIKKYGRQNPWVMAFILGKFPPTALNALFSMDELNDAMSRKIRADSYEFSQKRLGIDVARFGDDATIIFPRQGLRSFPQVAMRGSKSHEIAARIVVAKHRWEWERAFIDDTGGYGAGTIDACELAGVMVTPVNASSHAFDRRYYNRRAEMYFQMAQWVKAGGVLPYRPDIIKQFTAVTYWLDKSKLRIVEKDQIKALLQGHSPDDADALAQTFAEPDMPTEMQSLIPTTPYERALAEANAGRVISDYDPLEV